MDDVIPAGPAKYYSGSGTQFVIFRAGGRRIYWGLLNTEPEGGKDPPEGVREALCERLREFPEMTRRLIMATDQGKIVRTDLYDRDPVPNWSRGRVVLLGDAAHLTTPFIGQGAGISMEDSVVLAKELASLDQISKGRLALGLVRAGAGWEPHRPRVSRRGAVARLPRRARRDARAHGYGHGYARRSARAVRAADRAGNHARSRGRARSPSRRRVRARVISYVQGLGRGLGPRAR